jgi:hypothetical protein
MKGKGGPVDIMITSLLGGMIKSSAAVIFLTGSG